jgi:hypothetical protein
MCLNQFHRVVHSCNICSSWQLMFLTICLRVQFIVCVDLHVWAVANSQINHLNINWEFLFTTI